MKIPNFSILIVLKQNSGHKFNSIFSHNGGPYGDLWDHKLG